METFIPNQAAGLDFLVAAEELRRDEVEDSTTSISMPLQKLVDEIVSFISIGDFESLLNKFKISALSGDFCVYKY